MIGGLWGWVSCTSPAEHANPLDPQSPSYTTTGAITGFATSYYQPFQPVAGAMVHLLPGDRITECDANGRYLFADVPPAGYSLAVSAPGFQTVTVSLQVLSRQLHTQDVRLNGLPVFQSPRATSARVATANASTGIADLLFLNLEASVSDPDGANDIKKVQVTIPDVAFLDTLGRSTVSSRWERLLTPDELVGIDLFNLVGKPMEVTAEDAPGARVTSAPFFLARVIAEVPQVTAPDSLKSVSSGIPNFYWQVPAVPFAHTLRIEVYRLLGGFPTFVTAIGNIAAGTPSAVYPGRLSAGTYYWTLTVQDEYGNSSRSIEATFEVPAN